MKELAKESKSLELSPDRVNTVIETLESRLGLGTPADPSPAPLRDEVEALIQQTLTEHKLPSKYYSDFDTTNRVIVYITPLFNSSL